ncbi:MAG: acetyl-CoA carboxylase carboxyltransferase subunit beta, partial [Ruminococcus sp.]|nr:acetyl-CoA carboxylase carboxyltransferase subunit beta [Ruminococcus sp.]
MDLFSFRKPKNELESLPDEQQNVPFVPDEMWIKCPKCNTMLLTTDMEENLHVCTKCDHHFRMNAKQRIAMFSDGDSFVEHDADMESKNILDFPGYDAKLEKARAKGSKESVICGECKIGRIDTVLCAMDPDFMMGSMGTVTGEKITRAFEYATDNRLPIVVCTAAGGARMQEGILSLMQMAKTSGAVKRHSDAGLLYITILT